MKLIWHEARKKLDPKEWLKPEMNPGILPAKNESVICWGKAALQTWAAISEKKPNLRPALLIVPEGVRIPSSLKKIGRHEGSYRGAHVVFGEHPLPQAGSFTAGTRLIEFLSESSRQGSRRLKVYLSGGASSLGWVKRADQSLAELQSLLRKLYSSPLTIYRLNHERSQLCQLKGGKAARLAKSFGIKKIQVEVISDVAPFSYEVVGSGPFADGKTSHRVVLDNAVFVKAMIEEAKTKKIPILYSTHSQLGTWEEWISKILKLTISFKLKNKKGLLILGGEPQVDLPVQLSPHARGGRMSQIALGLTLAFNELGLAMNSQVLCMSSDGVDGNSGSTGIWVSQPSQFKKYIFQMRRELKTFNSAGFFRNVRQGAQLIPSAYSGTNVQDLVAIQLG